MRFSLGTIFLHVNEFTNHNKSFSFFCTLSYYLISYLSTSRYNYNNYNIVEIPNHLFYHCHVRVLSMCVLSMCISFVESQCIVCRSSIRVEILGYQPEACTISPPYSGKGTRRGTSRASSVASPSSQSDASSSR